MALTVLILSFLATNGWMASPPHVSLFTPRGVPAGTYGAFVTTRPLEDVVSELDPGIEARAVVAAEAFGQSGGYNRWKLARLYGGRRARVARIPRIENGQVVEAWTLVSPYPDPDLRRLEPGTLLIVLRLRN